MNGCVTKTLLLCGVLLLVLLAGCKSSRKVATVEGARAMSHREFIRSMEERSVRFRTFAARLNVDLELSGKRMSSKVELKMLKDSAFQLSVQPFLGIEVFRLELTPDSVKIMDRMNKRYMAENYANLRGQTPIEFNFYNLQALLTNRIFEPGAREISHKRDRFRLDRTGSVAEIRTDDAMGLRYTFRADGEEKLLSALIEEPSDRYSLRWSYEDFRLIGEQVFPRLMDVRLLDGGASKGGASLYFSRIQIDSPVTMDFPLSSKYERVTLEQVLRMITNLNM